MPVFLTTEEDNMSNKEERELSIQNEIWRLSLAELRHMELHSSTVVSTKSLGSELNNIYVIIVNATYSQNYRHIKYKQSLDKVKIMTLV